jgi:hypothetical protein
VALKPGQLLLIQCKRSGALPPDEWDRLVEVAAWVAAIPVLAANGARGRGVAYIRLTGPKRRNLGVRAAAQASAPFSIDYATDTTTDGGTR